MKILVLNCGSSTLKFQLIETAEAVIFSGGIGENSPAIREKSAKTWSGAAHARLLG
jgi:acetate kinase